MKVLVIGGSRYMGAELVWRLLLSGHAVTLFNRGRTPYPFGARVERLLGDRRSDDFARLLRGRRFDAAVDFAAYEGPDARAVVDVLDVGHYVVISTGQVYLVRDVAPLPARESDYDGPLMPRPEDPRDRADWEYGLGKRAVEDVLAYAWEIARFPSTRVRIPIVNGERDQSRRLEGYLWRILDGGPVLLPDGAAGLIRHVYAGDVVRFLLRVLGDPQTHGRAYNVCHDELLPLRDVLSLLAEAMGARTRFVDVPSAGIEAAGLEVRAVSPFSTRWTSRLDASRAREELDFAPRPLRQAFDVIARSFLAHLPPSPPDGYAQRAREVEVAEQDRS
ncbi:MAG: NAD-dependent epimerase/dehydratase family protein [Vicinamibacteria bacterium]